MTITRENTAFLLGESVEEKATLKTTLSTRGGTGSWDPNIGVFEPKSASVKHREVVSVSSSTVQNLVICNGLFTEHTLDAHERDIFYAFMKYKKVFAHPGPDKELIPFNPSVQLEENFTLIVPATALAAAEQTSKLNLSPKDYWFIDYEEWGIILSNYAILFPERFEKEHSTARSTTALDFMELNVNNPDTWRRVLLSVDSEKIKKIVIPPLLKNEFLKVLNQFPHLEELEVVTPPAAWMEDVLFPCIDANPKKFASLCFTLNNFRCVEGALYLRLDCFKKFHSKVLPNQTPQTLPINFLKVKEHPDILESIIIDDCHGVYLPPCRRLKSYEITRQASESGGVQFFLPTNSKKQEVLKLSGFVFDKLLLKEFECLHDASFKKVKSDFLELPMSLQKFEISEGSFKENNLRELKLLRNLRVFKNSLFNKGDLAELVSLENLDITGSYIHKDELSRCVKLRKFFISSGYVEHGEESDWDFRNCKDLSSVSIALTKAKRILLSSMITHLEIRNASELTYVDWEKCILLDTLCIDTCDNLSFPSFSQFRSLKTLQLDVFDERNLDVSTLDIRNCTLDNLSLAGFIIKSTEQFQRVKVLDICMCVIPDEMDFSGSITTVINIQHIDNDTLTIKNALHLVELTLEASGEIQSLSIQNCPNLRTLRVTESRNLCTLPADILATIETLELTECESFETFDFLRLPNLKTLIIKGCPTWDGRIESKSLERFSLLNADIRTLNLSHCPHLSSCELGELPMLRTLVKPLQNKISLFSATQCPKLAVDLKESPKLRRFFSSVASIDVRDSPCLTQLQNHCLGDDVEFSINCENCDNLQDLMADGEKGGKLEGLWNPLLRATYYVRSSAVAEKKEQKYVDLQTLEMQKRIKLNKTSRVSSYSLSSSVKMKSHAGVVKAGEYAGDFTVVLKGTPPIWTGEHRLQIFHGIQYIGNNDFDFVERKKQASDFVDLKNAVESLTPDVVTQLSALQERTPELVLGFFNGRVQAGQPIPLPDHQAQILNPKFKVYAKPPDAIEVKWDRIDQQYCFIAVKTQPIELLYSYEKNPDYEAKVDQDPYVEKDAKKLEELIPIRLQEALRFTIEKERAVNPKFAARINFLFDRKLKLHEKIKLLQAYCEFKDKPLKPVKIRNSFEDLRDTIFQRKGACEENAKAFLALSIIYLQVPVQMIQADGHKYCQKPYATAGGVIWRRVDLGGAEIFNTASKLYRLDMLDKNHRELKELIPQITLLQGMLRIQNDPVEKYIDSETIDDDLIKKLKYYFGLLKDTKQKKFPALKDIAVHMAAHPSKKIMGPYAKLFAELTEETELHSIQTLLDKDYYEKYETPPLISLAIDEDPWDVDSCIAAQVGDDYLFIDSQRELDNHLLSNQLTGEGGLVAVPGKLGELFKNGGTLVLNLSNFSPEEIVGLMSMFDPNPRYIKTPISKNLRIIGLVKDGQEACNAALSRCQHFTLTRDFFQRKESKQAEVKDQKIIEVDLQGRSDWLRYLTGKLQFEGEKVSIPDEGKLVEALRRAEKKEDIKLDIRNPPLPPDDYDFRLLWHKLHRPNGEFLCNGVLTKVPKNLIVGEPVDKPVTQNALNVHFDEDETKEAEEKTDQRARIYLGLHNWHELEEQFISVKPHNAKIHAGLLDLYDANKHVFYLSCEIPENDLNALKIHIHNTYYDAKTQKYTKEFYFTNRKLRSELQSNAPVIISNDPDYVVEQLKTQIKDPLIQRMNPKMDFADLIYDKGPVVNKGDSTKIKYIYEPKPLLKALLEERDVVLVGDIPEPLYQQLLPFLSPTEPRLICLNGKFKQIKGRLIVVMPKNEERLYPLECFAQRNYSLQDYRDKFPKKHVERIEKFYYFAEKLPKKISFSYQLMKRMCVTLDAFENKDEKHKPHPHNPLKRLSLNDDYLKVIGKMIFRPDDSFPVRHDKLVRLISQYKIDIQKESEVREHVWKLLNCYSGAELFTKLFSRNIQANLVEPNRDYPALTPTCFATFYEYLKQELLKPVPEKKISTEEKSKQTQQMFGFLGSARSSMLMLAGPAGVGKSFTLDELRLDKEHHICFEGPDAIQNWENDKTPGKIKLLILDEANMALPGTWDSLKDKVDAAHKVVFLGNPEKYAGRFSHDIMQHFADLIYFEIPKRNKLDPIVRKKLDKFSAPDICSVFIEAFYLAWKLNPTFIYSIRDIKNSINRFLVAQKSNPPTIDEAIAAVLNEYSGTFLTDAKRIHYEFELKLKFSREFKTQVYTGVVEIIPQDQKIPEQKLPVLPIPTSRKYMIDMIKQDLAIREHELKHQSDFYKKCVLLEGGSGLGKSTLHEALLQEAGFSQDSPDTQRRYYKITATTNREEMERILRLAFHEGAIVIIDELNLDTEIEILLNAMLLEGKDGVGLDAKPSERPGFMIFASQNPTHQGARKALSLAMLNRLHLIHMTPYLRNELIEIVKYYKIPEPEKFVTDFEDCLKAKPRNTNPRTIFNAIKRYLKPLVAASTPSQRRVV